MVQKLETAATRGAARGIAAVASAAERRWAGRRTGIMPGFVYSDRLQAAVACVVRDMSATGARIEFTFDKYTVVSSVDGLPDTFRVALRNDPVEFDAVIAWRRDNKIGVKLLGAIRFVERRKTRRPVAAKAKK